MLVSEKAKEVKETLLNMLYSDSFDHVSRWVKYKSNRSTKHIDDYDVEYIIEGLKYKGRFNQPWEGREEMTRRFLKVLVERGDVDLLLDATYGAVDLNTEDLKEVA